MQMSESIIEIAKAMSAFQGEIKQPDKSADNPFFKSKYVPLNKVIAAFKESGPKHGLSFLQYPVTGEHSIGVETLIMHSSGEWIKFDPFFLPIEKQNAQGAGSATTYAKRYALSAALGIDSDEDDDGNEASGNTKKQTKAKNDVLISDQQKNTIETIWKENKGSLDGMSEWIDQYFKKPIEKLTQFEAQSIISNIGKNRKKANA